jgi:hypothetical protein
MRKCGQRLNFINGRYFFLTAEAAVNKNVFNELNIQTTIHKVQKCSQHHHTSTILSGEDVVCEVVFKINIKLIS